MGKRELGGVALKAGATLTGLGTLATLVIFVARASNDSSVTNFTRGLGPFTPQPGGAPSAPAFVTPSVAPPVSPTPAANPAAAGLPVAAVATPGAADPTRAGTRTGGTFHPALAIPAMPGAASSRAVPAPGSSVPVAAVPTSPAALPQSAPESALAPPPGPVLPSPPWTPLATPHSAPPLPPWRAEQPPARPAEQQHEKLPPPHGEHPGTRDQHMRNGEDDSLGGPGSGLVPLPDGGPSSVQG